jgi:glycosyltransferase involved in cell wall biosynthesis
MVVERIAFFTQHKVATSHEQLRIYSPFTKAGIEVIHGIQDDILNLDKIQAVQAVLFQRDFPKKYNDFLKVVRRARNVGVPVILDLDDHLFELPPDHPDRISHVFAGSLLPLFNAILEVDAITVASPVLKEVLTPYNPNIFVLPNYLDADIWTFKKPQLNDVTKPNRILFMGTPTHKPDVEMISDALLSVAEKYGEQVSFVFFGVKPPEKLARLSTMHFIPMENNDYQLFVQKMQTLDADIAIAPLVNNLFNRCKSSIKYLEYSINGLPGIYSKLDPYSAVVETGKDGYLVDSTDDWVEKLSLLIEDPNTRLNIAINAQEKLRSKWMIEEHADQWNVVFSQIKLKGKSAFSDSSYGKILSSIAIQLENAEEKYKHLGELESAISTQRQEIIELQMKNKAVIEENQSLSMALSAAQREVVDYALSTSWKITRPLRRLGRFLRRG